MKNILSGLIAIVFTVFSMNAMAVMVDSGSNRVVIKSTVDKPVFYDVTTSGDSYMVNGNVEPISGYYFFNVNNSQKVCYNDKISTVSADGTPMDIKFSDTTRNLYCYDYDPAVFVLER